MAKPTPWYPPASLESDRRVDAHDFAVEVHQRAARVARVDRRIGLQEIGPAAGGQDAGLAADNARTDRQIEVEGMPDGQYPIADLQLVAVAQGGGGQAAVGLDPQHGKVGLLVGLDVGGTKLLAVGEFHQDFIGPFDNMIVGEDDALGVDNDAGTEPRSRGSESDPSSADPGRLLAEEVLEGRVRRGIVAGRAGSGRKVRGRMVVLILTTLGMIRLETARNALESDFAEAMSLASSARLAETPQQATMSIRAIRTMPDRPGVGRKLEFNMALSIRVRVACLRIAISLGRIRNHLDPSTCFSQLVEPIACILPCGPVVERPFLRRSLLTS